MLAQISEQQIRKVRWVLTCAWLLLIASLFYDPISPLITTANQTWSPFRIKPEDCIAVQNTCLDLQPYPLGAPIFWGMIVPSSIFILLVFGHELWRRICPLSFLSQIPRALGWQRQIKRTDSKTGKIRYEIPKVKKDSWLGKNYLYLQFGLLFIGLCSRILFINGNAIALGLWLLMTIAAAITVGYLYGGKTWCNYFCPMAPVQKVYAEPSALLATKAHMSDRTITQSMCRTITDSKEQSACVACQNPCIDIDSERSYWDGIEKPESKMLYYGYLGLVVGYFFYYYLYAGSWDYYFSGAWAMEGNSIQNLLSSGLYLYNQAIPIPKILAVPITLGLFTGLGYIFGHLSERIYRAYLHFYKQKAPLTLIRHHLFSICTFIAFNLFFIFGGRPFIRLLPSFFQETIDVVIVLLSTLWLYRTIRRDPELYAKEGLAGRFRKQLLKMNFPLEQYFTGKDIEELNPHEVYVLAKVLPGFTKQKRYEAYKGVLREALEEGYTNSSSSLEVLRQLRTELDISDAEHRTLLDELGVEDPQLLDPSRQRNLENLVRISGYRKAMERLMYLQNLDVTTASQKVAKTYSITPAEEREIMQDFDQEASLKQKSYYYLESLTRLLRLYHSLNQSFLLDERAIVSLLLEAIRRKKQMLVLAILEAIATLNNEEAVDIARNLGNLSPTVLQDILDDCECEWYQRLDASLIAILKSSGQDTACSVSLDISEVADALTTLLQEQNPLIQSASLYLLQKLDFTLSHSLAVDVNSKHPLVEETINFITKNNHAVTLASFPILERIVYLFNSDFFHSLDNEILIELGNRAYVKSYQEEEHISEAGDTCRELLLLIEGSVEIRVKRADQTEIISNLLPGKVLDELEVLTHTNQTGTITAKASPTRVLAIPVDTFDDLMDRDRNLAIKVLELESLRIKGLLGTV
ncbi:cyclic nucleotide-binding domain-containing protein [Pseudanabaena mucicola]|uniref:Cyclic nucleotide-binding domain-containing protein n=1 Tax=Pseudanabaena mucicola FACHB-723 TaxID=2692860 RepID=A0ABR7ZVQ4_9CYAN|nr:cyclic nucleotide-binding domain-containing protein [Pseudanabaena mucicola]MBD2187580.1 cyclic nucleotide-binding domain-containing protein [Pseudanabaena mucicola FACHB-723]